MAHAMKFAPPAMAGWRLLVVSADPEEKAAADHAEFGWRFPLGFGLTVAQMQALGLYISSPARRRRPTDPLRNPAFS